MLSTVLSGATTVTGSGVMTAGAVAITAEPVTGHMIAETEIEVTVAGIGTESMLGTENRAPGVAGAAAGAVTAVDPRDVMHGMCSGSEQSVRMQQRMLG